MAIDRNKPVSKRYSGFVCVVGLLLAVYLGPLNESSAQDLDSEDANAAYQTFLHGLRIVQSGEIVWPEGTPPSSTLAQPALSMLSSLAKSNDPKARAEAYALAGQLGERDAVLLLIQGLSDADPRARESALESLAAVDGGLVAGVLVERLLGHGPAGDPALLTALPGMRSNVEAPLIAIMADDLESAPRLSAAAFALGKCKSENAIEWLSRRAWVRHSDLALTCAEALAEINGPHSLDALEGLLRHPLRDVRLAALTGISRVGGAQAVSILFRTASGSEERDLNVRRRAARLLGTVNTPESLHALMRLMETDSTIRFETAAALRALTHQPHDASPVVWADWYRQWRANPVWPPPKPKRNQLQIEASPF